MITSFCSVFVTQSTHIARTLIQDYFTIINETSEQHAEEAEGTALGKSNANEIRGNSSFVLATFLRKVIEFSKDVSKGSKRKNHDLPRKFERTKFEVANFPGNQTKNRDTKFKAANSYDMNRS